MPVTRSRQGEVKSANESSTEGTGSDQTATATTSGTGTTTDTATDATEVSRKKTSRAPSRKSDAAKKRNVLAAREKLAALRVAEAEAVVAAAKAASQLAEERLKIAEEDSSEDEEQDDLASVRITKWLQEHPEEQAQQNKDTREEALPKEDHGARQDRIENRPGRAKEQPTVQRSVVDLAELTMALSQIATRRDPPKYLLELPMFNGQASGWLAFRAAFRDSESSFSKPENVARLRKSLKGAAYDAVGSLLVSQPEPRTIIEALERRFGRPEALVLTEMEKLRHLPRVSDSARELCIFAGRVANAVATVESLGREAYLHSPEMVRSVLEKLTPILRSKWYDYASMKKEDLAEMKKIAAFLNEEADKCGAYALPEVIVEEGQRFKKRGIEKSYATVASKPDDKCPHCKKMHKLADCYDFAKTDVSTRWEIAKKHHICFLCLRETHRRYKCQAKPCAKDGCGKSHHKLLHSDPPVTQTEPTERRQTEVAACATEPEEPHRSSSRHAYLKIAPIELIGPKARISTYALLDDGSTCTFVEESITELLGVDGPTDTLWIRDANGGEVRHDNSKLVNIRIKGRNETSEHILRDAQTIKKMDFTSQAISRRELEDCSHLYAIEENLVYNRAQPKVVIGQNNWNLIVSREVREGRNDQPVASLTHLGWVLHGCRYAEGEPEGAFCGYVESSRRSDDMEEMMKNFFKLESLGIEEKKPASDPEQRALRILEEKSKRLPDGRFETALLWRDDKVLLHNNYDGALKRLENLERKLDRDADLKAKYTERIEHLLTSNYAERATAPPTEGKTWYLPHFAVINPAKPKIRLVHDAAAKTAGKSLNDMLLTGPDLLQSLPGVVMRFRQHPYAVSADVKEMFMQVRIGPEDRDALRFLWRGDARGEKAPEEYRMTSVIFGASSSPCTALFIKNKNAQDYAKDYPAAAVAIEKNHYMDDYLCSYSTIEEAERVNKEVDFVHRQACFELRGWTSNDKRTIHTLTARSEEPTVSIGGSSVEKALGLRWNVQEDYIGFEVNTRKTSPALLQGNKPPTKREALSIIMSLFDPLGLISPVTTPAKRLMQDTWRFGTGWDESLPEELQVRWHAWIESLKSLEDLKIPRCYDCEPATTRQLHTFVDASEEAYAAAVYWRTTRADGSVNLALAAAKSRVTPLKPISIPRLELQAALLGARLAETVVREHDFEIEKKVYWCDSRTALAWIRAEPRTFKTFVAHRLAEIEDTTKKMEWRWLPSNENVADDATRATPVGFDQHHRWFVGPNFLKKEEDAWPTETPTPAVVTGEEKEKCFTMTEVQVIRPDHLPDIGRFSKWLRLIRVTARVLQFIARCRDKKTQTEAALRKGNTEKKRETVAALRKRTRKNYQSDPDWRAKPRANKPTTPRTSVQPTRSIVGLEAHFLIRAEQLWVLNSQRESFGAEIDRIQQKKMPTSGGRLDALSVAMGTDGALRLRGRIGKSPEITEETASPIVLDGKHAYTKLYIQHVHERLHHGGTEAVVNELRQRTWIVKIRPAVKNAIKSCLFCRLRKAKPGSPATGDLPEARLAHHNRAFSYTGLDYFGPLQVTVGRHHEKRYVALFTCMTSRAIHLEVVGSLSADSAIAALRRFIARRGCPREIHCDNATCFKAAERELRSAIMEAVGDEAANRQIQWRYIPPAAPFMGGTWERMVRSVKEALHITLHEKSPSEETLATLLAEVESTVNSRPLTHVAVTPEAPEAITPNHLLLGTNCNVPPPPGTFTEEDDHARQHWRRAQYLAEEFWRRWLREYLPLLQHRREPHTKGEAPKVGDLALVCDNNLPRNTWPRGKVIALHPGADGVVRVVDIITSSGNVLRRPSKKIVVLPVESRDGGDGGRMCTTALKDF